MFRNVRPKKSLTSATEFCNSAEGSTRAVGTPLRAPFCTRHLQHAKPFVYGPPADDAELCETANGSFLKGHPAVPS
jgi:hypothetical protein